MFFVLVFCFLGGCCFLYFNVPCRKFRSPYQGKTQQLQVQHYPFLSVFAVCSCVQTLVWLPVFGFFTCAQMLMHVIAYRGCTDTVTHKRVCTRRWLWEKKRKIPCRTLDLNSQSHHYGTWLFSCTLYPLNYSLPPPFKFNWMTDTGRCTMGDKTWAQRVSCGKSFKGKELCWVAQATVLPHLSPLSSPKRWHPSTLKLVSLGYRCINYPTSVVTVSTPSRLVSLGTIIPTKEYTLYTDSNRVQLSPSYWHLPTHFFRVQLCDTLHTQFFRVQL